MQKPNPSTSVGQTSIIVNLERIIPGVPVIFLNHLAATMDNCDPRIMDGIASKHQIICFDNRGVGATKGKTPKTIAEMARDARAFIHALGYEQIDLIGFSLGGFISQEILLQEPQLVRKAIITGTGPAGGDGIKNVTRITYKDILRGLVSFKDAKTFLFFNRNENGKKSAKAFLSRLEERKENRDKKMPIGNFQRQLKAIHAWDSKHLKIYQYLSKLCWWQTVTMTEWCRVAIRTF
jgi:pimeloyl-ACP methyl ester carboxylesterase